MLTMKSFSNYQRSQVRFDVQCACCSLVQPTIHLKNVNVSKYHGLVKSDYSLFLSYSIVTKSVFCRKVSHLKNL